MFEIPPDRQAGKQRQCPQNEPPQPVKKGFCFIKKFHAVRLTSDCLFAKIDASQKHHKF